VEEEYIGRAQKAEEESKERKKMHEVKGDDTYILNLVNTSWERWPTNYSEYPAV
tara:strand:+ start:350 stop:511 length:162 start_codon:yes stop_codon:yes gene_type:complete